LDKPAKRERIVCVKSVIIKSGIIKIRNFSCVNIPL
jgi:hypothetical protein